MRKLDYKVKHEEITPVTDGQTLQPYAEYTYSIPAQGREKIAVAFNWFKILSVSGGTLGLIIGDNGVPTPYTDTSPSPIVCRDIFDSLTLINNHASTTMTIKVAIGYGY